MNRFKFNPIAALGAAVEVAFAPDPGGACLYVARSAAHISSGDRS